MLNMLNFGFFLFKYINLFNINSNTTFINLISQNANFVPL